MTAGDAAMPETRHRLHPTGLTDVGWALLEPLLEKPPLGGARRQERGNDLTAVPVATTGRSPDPPYGKRALSP
jgi:hypothetical protein